MHRKFIRIASRLCVSMTVLAAILCSFVPVAFAAAASDITKYCAFTPSSNASGFRYATDGQYATKWSSAKSSTHAIGFTISASHPIGGIYFIWSAAPASWELFAQEGNGDYTSIRTGGAEGYLTQYVSVPSPYAGYRTFRLNITPVSSSSSVDLAEMTVFGPGDAPYYAPSWQPFTGRIDLLTIVSHPDDEALYMSVPMVTYANQGKSCETVFMTYGTTTSIRRYEAQECAWSLGNKTYPVMGSFPDVKTTSRDAMARYWSTDGAVGFLVEQIRKYKPSVVVTHDVNGEYGHGAHMLTQYATALAFQYAADPARYPDSANRYGTWQAGKLYVHLSNQNTLALMSLTETCPTFGGRTILKVIQDAYIRHDSQLPGRALPTSGAYDMRKFGLVLTNVGSDAAKNSMFENVTQDAMLNLNPWYRYEVVNRDALRGILEEAGGKSQSHYTPESWAEAGLPSALAAAQGVMDTRESTQAQVDEQAALLREAMGKLTAYLSGLEITSLPDRPAFFVGEPLDLTGLTVTGVYGDASRKAIAVTSSDITGFDSTVPATRQTLTVTYSDAYGTKTAEFTVDILPAGGETLASAVYSIDRSHWILKNITVGTTVESFLTGLTNDPAKVKLYASDGSEVTSGPLSTGMTIKLMDGDAVADALRLSVLGDVNGDGGIDITDILYLRADILDTYAFNACQFPAGDVNLDGVIDITDILHLRAHILGTYIIQAS